MSSLSDSQIRHMILEVLLKIAQDEPAGFGIQRTKMTEILQIPEKQMDFNVLYLEEKGLVKLLRAMSAPWRQARITAFGIDVVENKEKYKKVFPFIQTTIQEIHGNVYGSVIQAANSQVSFNQQVTDAFKQVYTMVEMKSELLSNQKEEIKKNVKLLEEELNKREPDAGKIQELWKWLKQNASWVVPTLAEVVLEGIKMALGSS